MDVRDKKTIRWSNPFTSDIEGLSHHTYKSKYLDLPIGFGLYLPPEYHKEKRKYKVLYWLHGKRGDEGEGYRYGVVKTLDKAVRDGKIESMIMVLVNGTPFSMYSDYSDGTVPAESTLIKELIPFIDGNYRTLKDRSGRGIEGFSMGGNGALKIALKYPELFSTIVSCGGSFHDLKSIKKNRKSIFEEVFGSDDDYYEKNSCFYLAGRNLEKIKGLISIKTVVGTKDFTLKSNEKLWRFFDKLEIDYEKKVIPGLDHDCSEYYKRLSYQTMAFHSKTGQQT